MSVSKGLIASERSIAGGGYSATVRLFLRFGDVELRLAQVGGNRAYLREAMVIPPGPGEVIVEIDGEATVTPVLIKGSPEAAKIIEYSVV